MRNPNSKEISLNNKFTDKDVIALISAVEEHPMIWLPHGEKSVKRTRAWKEVFVQLNINGVSLKELQAEWRSLCRKFKRNQWKYEKSLSFLNESYHFPISRSGSSNQLEDVEPEVILDDPPLKVDVSSHLQRRSTRRMQTSTDSSSKSQATKRQCPVISNQLAVVPQGVILDNLRVRVGISSHCKGRSTQLIPMSAAHSATQSPPTNEQCVQTSASNHLEVEPQGVILDNPPVRVEISSHCKGRSTELIPKSAVHSATQSPPTNGQCVTTAPSKQLEVNLDEPDVVILDDSPIKVSASSHLKRRVAGPIPASADQPSTKRQCLTTTSSTSIVLPPSSCLASTEKNSPQSALSKLELNSTFCEHISAELSTLSEVKSRSLRRLLMTALYDFMENSET